MINWCWSDK